MSSAETSAIASETYLTPLDLVKANKFIGKVEPPVEGQQFATFELTIGNKPIKLQCKGVLGSEIKASQFNPGKLQLYFDVSGSGEMLFAAENTKKEIQSVLDVECLPELDVSVTSWVKNKAIYLSWPRQRGSYKPIIVNGKKIRHGSDACIKFETDLQKLGGKDDQVEVGFSLYGWALYGKNADGTPNNKVSVGLTPTVEYVKYDEKAI